MLQTTVTSGVIRDLTAASPALVAVDLDTAGATAGRQTKVAALLDLNRAALPALAAQKYDIDTGHTQITFGWNHLGFSNNSGNLEKIIGTFQLDTADPTKSSVEVTMPLEGLHTGMPR